jgi:hypothetical protein
VWLQRSRWEILQHPPQSPDLATPTSIWLSVQNHLFGRNFDKDADFQREMRAAIGVRNQTYCKVVDNLDGTNAVIGKVIGCIEELLN